MMGGDLTYEGKYQVDGREAMAGSSRQVCLHLGRSAARDMYSDLWLLEYAVRPFAGRHWAFCWCQCGPGGQYLAEYQGLRAEGYSQIEIGNKENAVVFFFKYCGLNFLDERKRN